ncbi:HAD-IA family hydrolase [Pelagibacterium sp. H642]|uniref:HAD-IIA family hydrolase n=1 Tax=Pelagibacterium sp. H642 TaxID=1881069 RepID=UPI002816655D|nr:HAD-IA family hydrolase [Pelagibacterium sp. H642]WMT90447.1 HAD-IA family hydrolase [Pelagibacterium sp. H642]
MTASIPQASGYLIDMDGTLLTGDTLFPDAGWLLEAVADRFMLVSNDSEHTPLQLSRRLTRLGLVIAPDRIVLAGTAAIDMIADTWPGSRLHLLGSAAIKTYALQQGLELAEENVDTVLVTRDRLFTYQRLAQAAAAVHAGARLIVACPDTSHPGSDGTPVPEAGALAEAIMAAAGVRDHKIVGKPEPTLFLAACRQLGISPSSAVMIGDNAQTDGVGARRLGMRFFLVENGDVRSSFKRLSQAV